MVDTPLVSRIELMLSGGPLAAGRESRENVGAMTEREPSNKSDAGELFNTAPELRLAGTPAGETTAAERTMFRLRMQAVLVLGSLRQDARMIEDRLERSGRIDAVRAVTGSSALESAAVETEVLIHELDELLAAVVVGTVLRT